MREVEPDTGEGNGIDEVKILVFHFMETRMGVDVEQVAAMIDHQKAMESQLAVAALHEILHFGGGSVAYGAPKVLVLKRAGGLPAVLVDRPEEILAVKIDRIRPLPPLIEATKRPGGVWAVALIKGEIVLLVDLRSLLPCGEEVQQLKASSAKPEKSQP